MNTEVKIKWQGSHWKRASHAFLMETKPGEVSLCGVAVLSNDGEVFNEPQRMPCGSCGNKIKKLTG